MKRILGIDEAGRGCVLGPLIVGAFLAEEGTDADLRAAGANDSKRLSAARRLAARAALRDQGVEDHIVITARAIDSENLNRLEEAAIVELVRRHQPDAVIVDALGHPKAIPTIIARLEAATGVPFQMEPKADATYPLVGAASIVAKTTRDAALQSFTVDHGVLGSGYPSDPKTRAWLSAWIATGEPWPAFVRTRWDTIRQLSQKALFQG
jgi:ribonuclease HII